MTAPYVQVQTRSLFDATLQSAAGPVRQRRIHAPMSPRSTPPPTTATAKPTRARPRRSRSVMLNLPLIEAGERPDRRLEQLWIS